MDDKIRLRRFQNIYNKILEEILLTDNKEELLFLASTLSICAKNIFLTVLGKDDTVLAYYKLIKDI